MKESNNYPKSLDLGTRYNEVKNTLDIYSDTVGVAHTTGEFSRCITDEAGKEIQAIDFEGLPKLLCVGDTYDNKVIKSIKNAYLIEFEK